MARSQQCQLIQYRRRPMGTSDFAPSARWNPRKRFDQRPAGPMQSMEWSQQFYHLGLSTTNPPMEVYHVDVGWKPPIVKKTKDWKAIDHFLSVFSLSLGLPAPIFLRAPPGHPIHPIPRSKQLAPEHGHSHARALATRWVATWEVGFSCGKFPPKKKQSGEGGDFFLWWMYVYKIPKTLG